MLHRPKDKRRARSDCSVARGEQRSGNDIDIWVQLDPLTPYTLVYLKHELEDLLQAPVDVVRLRET